MKKKLLIFFGLLIIAILALSLATNNSIKFDNETPKYELITKSHDEKEFYSIFDMVDSKTNTNVKINQLNIKAECVRKTEYGGYAIYNLNSGKELYIFFNDEKRIIAYTTVSKFISSSEIKKYTSSNASSILKLGSGISITTSGTSKETLIYFLNDKKVAYVKFDKIISTGEEKIYNILLLTDDEYISEHKNQNWSPYILPKYRYVKDRGH